VLTYLGFASHKRSEYIYQVMTSSPYRAGRLRRRHQLAGFTLVEMLVVLAIISILTSLVVVGLGGNRAAKLSADGNAIADMIGLAQQNALGKNTPTALVFVQTVDGAQAFSIYQLDTTATPPWTQVTMWKFLAAGVAMDTANSSFPSTAGDSPGVTPPFSAIPIVGGKAVTKFGYEVFLPSSQIFDPSGTTPTPTPRIHLVEGVVQGGNLISSGQSAKGYYDVLINPITGRPIVERL